MLFNTLYWLEIKLKSLVVYYSRTGNARFVAETIAAEVGADIEEVVNLKKRSGTFGFLSSGFAARFGKGTKIAPTAKLPAAYDLVIVGTPVWAGQPTPAIRTYLKKNDFSGKKVAVFFAQGGKKPQGIEQTKALMPNSTCIGELSMISPLADKEASEKQIATWCQTLTHN